MKYVKIEVWVPEGLAKFLEDAGHLINVKKYLTEAIIHIVKADFGDNPLLANTDVKEKYQVDKWEEILKEDILL